MDDSEILKIAKLARLDLKDEEIGKIREKFNGILEYMNLISEIQDEIPVDVSNAENLRVFHEDDSPSSGHFPPTDFSSYTEDDFFKVPKVIE